jgi:DNA-binding transcriptional ArsR family regulator
MTRGLPARPGIGAPPLEPAVAELRALAHPLRLRILELFAERARTTKQVADLLGEPPTRLYHHVAALERAGLLVLRETRKNRGTVEKWFEAVAPSFSGTPSGRGTRPAKESAARRAVAMTVVEQSRREVALAMHHRGDEPPLVARVVVVAQPKRIAEFRKRVYRAISDIQREFASDEKAEPEAGDARWAMTLTFAPVSSKARRRTR